ncbi:hypothetical protein ACJX0J_034475, partial [Zea mays]
TIWWHTLDEPCIIMQQDSRGHNYSAGWKELHIQHGYLLVYAKRKELHIVCRIICSLIAGEIKIKGFVFLHCWMMSPLSGDWWVLLPILALFMVQLSCFFPTNYKTGRSNRKR